MISEPEDFEPYIERIELEIKDRKPFYQIFLSRSNFNDLAAGCQGYDKLFGCCIDNNAEFEIYPSYTGEMPETFSVNANNGAYFIYASAQAPRLGDPNNTEDFERNMALGMRNLEDALNGIQEIPIIENGATFGYVSINVEAIKNKKIKSGLEC